MYKGRCLLWLKKITSIVKSLISECLTSDPKKICCKLGIYVYYKEYSNDTKGYYSKIMNNEFIVINSNLSNMEQLNVLAHEIGHAKLHSKSDYILLKCTYTSTNELEEEANMFAHELLKYFKF